MLSWPLPMPRNRPIQPPSGAGDSPLGSWLPVSRVTALGAAGCARGLGSFPKPFLVPRMPKDAVGFGVAAGTGLIHVRSLLLLGGLLWNLNTCAIASLLFYTPQRDHGSLWSVPAIVLTPTGHPGRAVPNSGVSFICSFVHLRRGGVEVLQGIGHL